MGRFTLSVHCEVRRVPCSRPRWGADLSISSSSDLKLGTDSSFFDTIGMLPTLLVRQCRAIMAVSSCRI